MSLRTMKQFLIASGLVALGVAGTGCGDSDNGPKNDDMDGGTSDGGRSDARVDARVTADGGDEGDTTTCGETTCEGVTILSTDVKPCCTTANTCGLDAEDIKKANPASTFTGCVPKDVPAAVDKSTYCGAFFDQVEPTGNHANNGLDLSTSAGDLVFNGCCLPTGECGAMLTSPVNPNGDPIGGVNIRLGCVGFSQLAAALAGAGDAGAPMPTSLPFCNTTTGEAECPATLGPICASLKARGLPITCTAETATPKWVCGLIGMPRDGVPVVEDGACLEGLPFAAQGCGTATPPEGSRCIPVASDKFGCGDRPPAGPVFPDAPKMVCGCGEGTASTNPSSPCIPNAPTDVCGANDPTSEQLAGVPNFLCGCGETVAAQVSGQPRKPCLSYLPTSTCGGAPVPPSTAQLQLPAALCGCNTAAAPATPVTWNPATMPVPCLSKLPHTSCGSVAAAKTDRPEPAPDCLTGYPEYQQGCGTATPAPTYPPTCIPNAEKLYGCDDATANVAGQPSFLCGCGENVPVPNAPCLSNVSLQYCGSVPFTGTAVPLVPDSVCGCDVNPDDTTVVKWNPLAPAPNAVCLSTLPSTVCGNRVVCTADPFGTQGSCPAGTICVNQNPGNSTTGDACVAPTP